MIVTTREVLAAPSVPPKGPVLARGGIAASAHPFVAEAGLEVLRSGGNAIDAAIAAAAVMMCTDSTNSHLGADAFCIIQHADGTVDALGGAGAAPSGATFDYFRALGGLPKAGLPLATVPGVVDLWSVANKRFGTKPLGSLLVRAIAYAREGIPVTAHLHGMLVKDSVILGSHPLTAGTFLPGGKPPAAGQIFAQPNLARSLERIGEGGADEFYRGAMAREMVAFSEANGGLFALDDFGRHTTEVMPPLASSYQGYTVFEEPPVSPGIVMLLALNILKRFDMQSYDAESPERYHLMLEALKLAFGDRRSLGDPRFVENDLAGLLSDDHADEQAARIGLHSVLPAPSQGAASSGTEHAVFADAAGNVVAYIQSTNHSCGNVLGDTGVLLNSRMVGFSMDPASPNVVAPRKRPINTLTNYLVHDRDGNFMLAGGSPGGHFQVQTNLQVLTNIIDYGMSLTDAIAFPRVTVGEARSMDDSVVRIESRASLRLNEGLAKIGHRVESIGAWENNGVVQLVSRNSRSGLYQGATDMRRADAIVSGF